MTDTGRIPGEGQPENAGAPQEQPGTPAPGGYTFTHQPPAAAQTHQDDLLLMPSAQGAWGDPGQPVPQNHPQAVASAQQPPADASGQVAPAADPGHLPEGHEVGGRDSGVHDYSAVRTPAAGSPVAPLTEQTHQDPAQQSHAQQPSADAQFASDPHANPAGGGPTPRRPLHLGPPEPEQSGAVRSLADRGPSESPAQRQAPAEPAGVPEVQTAPPDSGEEPDGSAEPEYLDVPPTPADGVAVAPQPVVEEVLPGPQLGVLPPQPGEWQQTPPEAVAETAGQPATAGQTPEPELTGPDLASQPSPGPETQPVQGTAQVPDAEQGAVAPATDHVVTDQEVADPAAMGTGGETPVAEQPQEAQPPVVPNPTPEQPAGVPDATEGAEAVPETVGHQPVPAPPAAGVPIPAPGVEWHTADSPQTESGAQLTELVTPQDPASQTPVQAVPGPRAAEPESRHPEPSGQPVEVPAAQTSAEPASQTVDAAEAVLPGPPAEHSEPETVTPDQTEPQAEQAEQPVGPDVVADEPPAEVAEEGQPEAALVAPAPGYSDADREAVHRAMRERRDVRNGFRPDPIPHEVLLRVLEAAHTAPSVGHSQPWDFVIIRSAQTRRTMHELATQQREAYAKSLPKGRAKQFKELKVEAILDTPVNIVVTADPTRGGRHTLGRHTQPQMAPYSSALAVENLWLAARAEGLGVGWVSFFDEREMVRELGLPDHLEVVAYLCVGYVDAFPEEPELVQSGWSGRRPLSWVVHEESYGRRVLPGAAPHDLLSETLAGIRPLDAKALGEAWERQKRMTKPAGALGMLEIISAQLSGLARQCPPPVPEPAAVAVFAGDHGVHAQGVTPWPQEVTAQMVANFLGGGAVCNAFATQVGAEVCVVDVGVAGTLPSTPGLLPRKVRPGTADFSVTAAMTREEAQRAVEVGIETARDLVAAGNKALLTGEMGIANTTVSAALIAVYTGADPGEVTGRGTGVSDEMHSHKAEVVRRALELHQVDPADPLGVLAAIGGLEHAALVGLILGGASLRTPVILDGVSAGAAALVARAMAPEALAACIAGHRSPEPGHVAALTTLGLRPLIDLDLRLGEGTGALLALPVVQSTARAMHEVATFDAAGVTEKN